MTNDFLTQYAMYVNYTKTQIVNIETTFRCPLKCPFCYRQENNKEIKNKIKNSKDIPVEDLKKLIVFFDSLSFCGQISDPIAHPNFIKLLEVCQSFKEKPVYINTTGTRKSEQWWKTAFNVSNDNTIWVFGLDGTDQETANIYRVNTRFDEVMRAMKMGVALGKKIQWNFIIFKHNEHQIELAKQIAAETGIELRLVKSGRWEQEQIDKHQIYPPSDKWRTKNKVTKIIMLKEVTYDS